MSVRKFRDGSIRPIQCYKLYLNTHILDELRFVEESSGEHESLSQLVNYLLYSHLERLKEANNSRDSHH